jgi:hypothetical protein
MGAEKRLIGMGIGLGDAVQNLARAVGRKLAIAIIIHDLDQQSARGVGPLT